MRILTIAAALCVCTTGLFGQQVPDPAITPPNSEPTTRVDSAVNAYFRGKIDGSRSRKDLTLKAVRATPESDVVVVELQNGWLKHAFRVRSSNAATDRLDAPGVGTETLDAAVDAFANLRPASEADIAATLRTLGLQLADVYRPPSAPYYTNGRGVMFYGRERRFLLVVRGVRDVASNACFKAAIDVATASLISNADIPCVVE